MNPTLMRGWNTFTDSLGAGNRTGITGARPSTRPTNPAPQAAMRVPPVSAGSRQPAGYRPNPDLLIRTHPSQYPAAAASDPTTRPGYNPFRNGYPQAPGRSNPPAAPARPAAASSRGWAAPAAAAGAAAAGAAVLKTPASVAKDSERTTMLQQAGMPALHQIEPIAQPSAYGRVGSAAQGHMLSQFSQPPADNLTSAWRPTPTNAVQWSDPGQQSQAEAFSGRDITGGIRPVPMDDTQYQTLSAQGDAFAASQFARPGDFGVNTGVVRPDPVSQNAMREAFHSPASRAATIDAFQGDTPAAEQAKTRAPVQGGMDFSRIADPGIRAWAEHHKDSPRSMIDGMNIVERYMKKQGYDTTPAESVAMPGNTPEAQTLMQGAFKSGSPDLGTSLTNAPQEGSFAQAFKQRHNRDITAAFQGNEQFSPGLSQALQKFW
ncbi:MAG: hypothetical protein VKI63_06070 [Cyanobium sp.]|nr:hypothetical protein [Cyanobium sp.]